MKARLSDIAPNPYRDFELYPLDEEQVQRLRQSIRENGVFSSIPVRKNPTGKGYQSAAGEHRKAAAKLEGLTEIEVMVEDYDDDTMVSIMTAENMAQRGHNVAAELDSVAAYARIVSKAVLLGDEKAVNKILLTSDDRTLARVRAQVADGGPGIETIYRAINGFDRKDRAANKQTEIMTETSIASALAQLKQGGKMGDIVSGALDEVNVIRKQRETAEVEAVEAERRRVEAEAVAAQKALEAVYDIRCVSVFQREAHEKAFRDAVLSENGRRFIPRDSQFNLARSVSAKADETGKNRTAIIKEEVWAYISEAMKLQKEVDDEEEYRRLLDNARDRVKKRWRTIASGFDRIEQEMEKLVEDKKEWDWKEPFPMDFELVRRITDRLQRFNHLKKQLGV